MSLRTSAARWFELLTARDDLTLAVESIARTGSVELETHSEATTRPVLPDLHGRLEEYTRLAQRYQQFWPGPENLRPSELPGQPSRAVDKALGRLMAWRNDADPIIYRLEAITAEEGELALLAEFLGQLKGSQLRPELLPTAGPTVGARLLMLPRNSRITAVPAGVMYMQLSTRDHLFGLFVGPPHEVDSLEQELSLQKGRRLPLPDWLGADVPKSLEELERRGNMLQKERSALNARLSVLNATHHLHEALGDIARLEWFLNHVEAIPVTENFAWVTGWTSDLTGEVLNTALRDSGIRALVRFPNPPREKTPPMVFQNPGWARPFELFARLLGTPSAGEADPSRLLVIIVPLLFGYMFGDVGQGSLLVLAGLLFSRYQPVLKLLVPAGLMAMVFGVFFGSVFSRSDILPALWLHPMDQPIVILTTPLLAGALILLLGLILNGVEAHWRGIGRLWWLQEAGMLVAYIGLVGAFLAPGMAGLLLAGLIWYLAGSLVKSRTNRFQVMAGDIARLIEDTAQLAINTLSFARVGAFALAHAGLSLAVVALAQSSQSGILYLTIMLLGNALIIMLEGLVVSIQITRLVLFEFFIRFLRGEGRTFRPLAAPPGTVATRKEKHR